MNNIPKLVTFLLCDQVIREESTNKSSIIGTFTNIFANKLPAVHPQFVVFVGWLNNDIDGDYTVDIRILSPDGNTYLPAEIKGHKLKIDSAKTGTYGVFTFNGVQFKEYGKHMVQLYLDDDRIGEIPLFIKPPQN